MKRTMDVICAGLGLLLLWPVFLVVAVLIKLDDRGPVLFLQERIGRRCKPFMIYKFRTMVVDAPLRGAAITARDDRRITRVGQFLRHTKLDELPQLFNVLKGDMSLVGARPEVARYVDLFRDEYTEILKLRPGITDMASIRFRDEASLLSTAADAESVYIERILPEKLRLARHYASQSSSVYDVRLILTTVICLLYPARAIERVVDLLNPHRVWLGVLAQGAALAAAYALALEIRFDGAPPVHEQARWLRALPLFVSVQMLWLYPFRLFHGVWRYSGLRDLLSIGTAVTLGSASAWLVTLMLPALTGFSRGVITVDALLAVGFLAGMRLARRCHRELRTSGVPTRTVLLVGEEDHMERVLRELVVHQGTDCQVVGMLNGDVHKKGVRIHGVPILGTKADLADTLRTLDPDEVLVAMPASDVVGRDEVLKQCRSLGKFARPVPDVSDFLQGREKPSLTGGFNVEDLLFREPIRTDGKSARAVIGGKCVMVTGAGGSIGSEICRQVAASRPQRVVLFERHEFALYEIERELRRAWPEMVFEAVIGDVADASRVDEIMAAFRPAVVFHAAAYKHVPMMEKNPGEALRTNVVGTRTVAQAAIRHGAETFVLVSTDKAVEPVCMMGMSKRMAELAVQLLVPEGRTKLLTVRFGNVLDSSGSVLPLFREQIERGGPVTVTHADVTRLFMTVPEAVQLILQAASMGHSGEVFVLDMGKPIRILDLAKALIGLYGLTPGKDIEVVITGLRPGERLFEKLLNDHETVWKSGHPKILRAVSHGDLSPKRDELARLLRETELRISGKKDVVRDLTAALLV